MYRILVSNDDGINAAGIRALVRSLGYIAEVYVAAPMEQKSAMSHASTFRTPIKVEAASVPGAKRAYAISGTPVDCVLLGLQLLEEDGIVPDFVISGINMGGNAGASTIYSGTIGAAREGALHGVRSIALSVDGHETENFEYICTMLKDLFDLSKTLDPSVILSVNAPDVPMWKVKGVKITDCAEYGFGEKFGFEKLEAEGEYMMKVTDIDCDKTIDNDWNALKDNYATVSPVNAYSNDKLALKTLQGLSTDTTVAVFIDLQEKLVPAMRKSEDLLANNVKLAKCLNRLDVPMLATTQYKKGLGDTIEPLNEAMGKHDTIEKVTFSCFGEKQFADSFLGVQPGKIILTGIESHICLQQTALDFLARGYQVYIAKDCCQSRKKQDFETAMNLLASRGCTITTWEAIVYELMGTAKHPAFKTISKIVKEG